MNQERNAGEKDGACNQRNAHDPARPELARRLVDQAHDHRIDQNLHNDYVEPVNSGEGKRGPLHAAVITHSRRNFDHCGQEVADHVREKEWKTPVAAAQQRTDDEELKRKPDHQTAELDREAHPAPILGRAPPRIAGFLCCDYAVTERFPSHGSGGRMGPLAIITLPSHGSGGMGPWRSSRSVPRIGRDGPWHHHVPVPRIGRIGPSNRRPVGGRSDRTSAHPTDRAGGWARWRSSRCHPTDRAGGWARCAIITFPSHGSGGRMGPLATFTGSASSSMTGNRHTSALDGVRRTSKCEQDKNRGEHELVFD